MSKEYSSSCFLFNTRSHHTDQMLIFLIGTSKLARRGARMRWNTICWMLNRTSPLDRTGGQGSYYYDRDLSPGSVSNTDRRYWKQIRGWGWEDRSTQLDRNPFVWGYEKYQVDNVIVRLSQIPDTLEEKYLNSQSRGVPILWSYV